MNAEGIETLGLSGLSRPQTAFGCSPDFLDNRFVYILISPRMRGLSIGINVSPEGCCNFECLCCEVQRNQSDSVPLDVALMTTEFERTLALVRTGKIAQLPDYSRLTPELLELRGVVLSGDGEPTLAPKFAEAVERLVHIRAHDHSCNYKLILPTNGSALDLPSVQESLKFFTSSDEIWIKLDGGTQAYMSRMNGRQASLEKILGNILLIGKQRPVIIQSMFPSINGEGPEAQELQEYLDRLNELKAGGADISMIHIYSAARPASISSGCGHLPLKTLSKLCHQIKATTGIRAEFF